MRSVNLQAKPSKAGSWTHRDTKDATGTFEIAINTESAHVAWVPIGIIFAVDRVDVPGAWMTPIVALDVREQLMAVMVQRASIEVFRGLFEAFQRAREDGVRAGADAIRTQFRKVMDL